MLNWFCWEKLSFWFIPLLCTWNNFPENLFLSRSLTRKENMYLNQFFIKFIFITAIDEENQNLNQFLWKLFSKLRKKPKISTKTRVDPIYSRLKATCFLISPWQPTSAVFYLPRQILITNSNGSKHEAVRNSSNINIFRVFVKSFSRSECF